MAGIRKTFGSAVALDEVDLEVPKGSIHAIVGENGAGKTTLMRILYGALQPDAGTIEINGQQVSRGTPAQAIRSGIGMMSQHAAIVPGLSCLQNLILGMEPSLLLDLRRIRDEAEALATRLGYRFQWDADASELSPAGAQRLEVLKLLWRKAQVMILDEPTAMLSPVDADALFEKVVGLANDGATVLLVTHRLPEVMRYCQDVTVLRAGKKVAAIPVSQTTGASLAEMIVGGAFGEPEPRDLSQDRVAGVTITGLSLAGAKGEPLLRDLNLEVGKGEILGIAGVDGNGQRELFRAILGLEPRAVGKMDLAGQSLVGASSRRRLSMGISVIPEDRQGEALVEEWPIEWNSSLGSQDRPPFASGGSVNVSSRHEKTLAIASRFNTKYNSVWQPIGSLSGGNQQRFVAARALLGEPKLILAFQPARGLDILATRDVYAGLRERCREGAGAIVVSFDLDELLDNCDRIAVMSRGVLRFPPKEQSHDRNLIGRLMVEAE